MIGNAMIDPLDDALVSAVGAAEDLRAGLSAAVRVLRRDYPVEGVQWCTRAVEDAALRVELSCGESSGPRVSVSLGAAGTIVLIGEQAGQAEAAVAGLRPLLHHWWTAEQLDEKASRLARNNQALADFAALVTHDLKAGLAAASGVDPPGTSLWRLELVDSISEAALQPRPPVGPQASSSRPVIDVTCAVDLLAAAVEDRGEHLVYPSVDDPAQTSLYAYEQRPLVEQALTHASSSDEDLALLRRHSVRQLYVEERLPVVLTVGALLALETAERCEVRGLTWGEALQQTWRAVALFTGLIRGPGPRRAPCNARPVIPIATPSAARSTLRGS